MTAPPLAVPDGFVPLFRTSPFLDLTGPYFHRPLAQGFLIGLRVAPTHTNASGIWHGGAIATLADVALGYVTAASRTPPLRMITSSLGVDYVGAAQVGDWVQAEVQVTQAGSRLAFAQALITATPPQGEAQPVASARAVFLVVGVLG